MVGERIRFQVFKRDNFTCQYCGRKSPDTILELDHITPTSKGGKTDLGNLITSCKECNRGKSDIEVISCLKPAEISNIQKCDGMMFLVCSCRTWIRVKEEHREKTVIRCTHCGINLFLTETEYCEING
jgi:ribosomal protein L37E